MNAIQNDGERLHISFQMVLLCVSFDIIGIRKDFAVEF